MSFFNDKVTALEKRLNFMEVEEETEKTYFDRVEKAVNDNKDGIQKIDDFSKDIRVKQQKMEEQIFWLHSIFMKISF